MAKSNFIVRGGGDFSGIKKGLEDTQRQLNSFQSSAEKTMSKVGTAFKVGLGYISTRVIAGFIKETTKWGSDVAEIQNVVNVTFGAMTKDIEKFSKSAMDNFGLSELASKKYSSTMGAMLKSSGVTGETMRDMATDLTKLTADMASFHNLENDEVFRKIMSGMSGMSMPLKELGINMNVANLEAFAMAEGMGKAYSKMNQAEQAMLRYNYLLSVTGDMQGDFSRNAHNWGHQLKILSEQWNTLKATIGQGFINMLAPVIRSFNVLIKYIQIAAEYFKAFTALIFGDTQASRSTSSDLDYVGGALGGVSDGYDDVGKSAGGAANKTKKAAKEMKKALAGFDELNVLGQKANAGDSGGGGGGAGSPGGSGVGPVDLGQASTGEVDLGMSKIEEQLDSLGKAFENFYNNWGAKDIFDGIRAGVELVNFDAIKENFEIAFSGLGRIAETAFEGMQPIFKAAGETLGTIFKYGIAIAGNLFEPISAGFAEFVVNMEEPIQSWILETSETITNGFNNLTDIYENLGKSWLESIEKYKPIIAKETENTLTNIAETYMLFRTVTSDIFEQITGSMKDFTIDNKKEISLFMDNVLGIITDSWSFINKVWEDNLKTLKDFWDTWGRGIVESVGNVMSDIGGWFLKLWNDLVKPVWDTMLAWLNKIWDETWKEVVVELIGTVGRIGELIGELWDKVFKPFIELLLNHLVPKVRDTWILIVDIIGSAVKGIGDQVKSMLKIFNGIIDFLTGVFSGDWKKVWEGIKNIFKGVVDSFVGIFKTPMNIIISGMNAFIRSMNRIQVPDWVPGVGGLGFNMTEIPHLAKGGITNGPMVAVVGDNPGGKEVVSPLDDLMSMITTAVSNASESNSNGNTTLVVKLGEDTLMDKVIENINRQNRISGETIISV